MPVRFLALPPCRHAGLPRVRADTRALGGGLMHITPIWENAVIPLPWMDHGRCTSGNAEVFFASDSDSSADDVATAKAICHPCPVRAECLAYAMQDQRLQGIWGGQTEEERKAASDE